MIAMLVTVAAALGAAQCAAAAITVGSNPAAPALRVDAAGNAEVSWTAGGRSRTLLVPSVGTAVPGGTLPAGDVSRAVPGSHVPFQRALRSGPAGWYYALQAWRVDPGGPVVLRYSRWRGVPTEVSLTAAKTARGVRLGGRVTLDEHPLPEASRAPVFVDSLVDGAWKRLAPLRLSAAGRYARTVSGPNLGKAYRVTVPGPNVGATYAPDASAVVHAPVELDPGR